VPGLKPGPTPEASAAAKNKCNGKGINKYNGKNKSKSGVAVECFERLVVLASSGSFDFA